MGTVFGKNTTSTSITVAGHKVYYIDSADAEIVEVQDGNNVKYNAFKYSLSGAPYWYVIDGTHDTWTDDLSAWGYSEVPVGPVLPEVDILNTLGQDAASIASQGYSYNLKYWSSGGWYGNYEAYDSTKSYAAVEYGEEAGVWLNPCNIFVPVNRSGDIAVQNISSSSKTFRSVKIAVCSDSTATVVTVYDSSNVAYNAFKYTTGGTDYYYVLDGTQTDWTDDLSSIGYSLTPNYLKGYVDITKLDAYVTRYAEKTLYDDAGNAIIGDSSKTYTIIGVYTANGGSVSYRSAYLYVYGGKLSFVWNDSAAYMAYVEYTVS